MAMAFEEKINYCIRNFNNYADFVELIALEIDFYKSNPQHTMFIPYSLINVSAKKFYHSDYIEKDYLIFERKRILEYHNDRSFENSATFKIVNKCIETDIKNIL
jgi:hypothetical protein